jgi:hypothetical protein
MARLWSSGAELNSNGNGVENDIAGTTAISSTTKRSGDFSHRINISNSSGFFQLQFLSANTLGHHYIRIYIRIVDGLSALIAILQLFSTGAAGRGSIRLASDNTLELWDMDSKIGNSSSALSLDTWYMVELEIDASPASGSRVLKARLDGIEFASATNLLSSDVTSYAMVRWGIGTTESGTADIFIDDIAINDSSGSFQNSYPGEGEIIHLKPNAAGDNNAWVKNGGGAGDTNNFNQVDEVAPDDGTSNLETPSVLDAVDDYNLDATPAALAADDTINCVQVGVRFRTESAGTGDGFCVRIKASASGTVEESAEITPTSTTWLTNSATVGSAPRNHPLTLYDLPGASTTAWTKADLDQAQIGIRETDTDGTVATEVSTLWLLVDHKPFVAPPAVTYTPGFMTTNTGFWGN